MSRFIANFGRLYCRRDTAKPYPSEAEERAKDMPTIPIPT
jgi:hypothetical protein